MVLTQGGLPGQLHCACGNGNGNTRTISQTARATPLAICTCNALLPRTLHVKTERQAFEILNLGDALSGKFTRQIDAGNCGRRLKKHLSISLDNLSERRMSAAYQASIFI
ncbi:hypothetical protein Zmor_001236 [Zophobas morio]|uniref:Uncharacterized protein n=1 Tax=Zophobas morio TaxID=2755281 RepID=A0AA38IYV7_9CUCU|nr:hypothetical protein Zmor_001236 [Zophobas morio]